MVYLGLFTSYLILIVALFVALADLPFYAHYHTHISSSALHWTDSKAYMLKLILFDKNHLLVLLLFLLMSIAAAWWFKKITNAFYTSAGGFVRKPYARLLLVLPFIILGIRGRLEKKSVIHSGIAVHSTNHHLNMLGMNAALFFLESTRHMQHTSYAAFSEVPIELAKDFYRTNFLETYTERAAFLRATDTNKSRPINVVLIISESLSANKTGLYPHGYKYTPHTDSLARMGIFFPHFFSDGIHTFNGVYSSLTGMHTLPLVHPLKQYVASHNEIQLPQVLNEKGYTSLFFTTHDKLFDNLNGFAGMQGFQQIVSQENFSPSEVIGVSGVPDHILFDRAKAMFDTLNQPFFACLLTGSDHKPFAIPKIEGFTSRNDEQENATAYADFSLGRFMQQAATSNWHAHTIFIITGDHGSILHPEADKYLSMLHVPLILYAPEICQAGTYTQPACQADIAPTILGLLGIPNEKKTLGIDVFTTQRKAVYATYDDEILTLAKNFFYIHRKQAPHYFGINETQHYCPPLTCSDTCRSLRILAPVVYRIIKESELPKNR